MKEFLLSIIAGVISNKFSETFKPFQKNNLCNSVHTFLVSYKLRLY